MVHRGFLTILTFRAPICTIVIFCVYHYFSGDISACNHLSYNFAASQTCQYGRNAYQSLEGTLANARVPQLKSLGGIRTGVTL